MAAQEVFHKISLFDLDRKEAEHFSKWLRDQHNLEAHIQDRLEDTVSDASLILFTTTTLDPYLADEKLPVPKKSHSMAVRAITPVPITPRLARQEQYGERGVGR